MTFGFFLSYIFTKWTGIVRVNTGLLTGATIGLFIGLYTNFVFYSMTNAVPYKTMGIDIAITVITSAIVGAIIAVCNSKIK
jgi:ABC-type antimicrobial peptide transport system permease subunit